MKKYIPALKWGLIPLFLFLCVLILNLFSAYSRTEKESLYLTPLLDDSMGWTMYADDGESKAILAPGEEGGLEPGQTFYLSRTLDAKIQAEGYTYLQLDGGRPCAVFLDDSLLYTNCSDVKIQEGRVSFSDQFIALSQAGDRFSCTLPEDFAGKRLTIATVSDPNFPYTIVFSSRAIDEAAAMAVNSQNIIPATAFAMTALLLIGFWLFGLFQGIYGFQPLLLMAAALLQMFSYLRQLSYFTVSTNAADSYLLRFVPILTLLLPLAYLLTQMEGKKRRIVFGAVLGLSAAASLLATAVGIFTPLPFEIQHLCQILYLPLLLAPVFSLLEAKAGNGLFRLFLGGLCATLLGMVVILFSSGYYSNMIKSAFENAMTGYCFELFNWLAVLLLFLSALISIYTLVKRTARTQSDLAAQTERASRLDQDLSVQKQFYETKLSHESEIRALHHDMKGHLATLSSLLEGQKLAEAKEYLSKLSDRQAGTSARLFCADPYMNAVLTNYARICQEDKVSFVCHVGIEDSRLPSTEVCLILNNALENALEASLKLPEEKREIKVQAAIRQGRLLMRISNPFEGTLQERDGLPVTAKKESGHGYGLFNIRQAALRRGGSMKYSTAGGHFVLDVQLPLEN